MRVARPVSESVTARASLSAWTLELMHRRALVALESASVWALAWESVSAWVSALE